MVQQSQSPAGRRSRRPATAAHPAAIIQGATDAIISKNLDGIVQSWNPSAVRLFGFTAEEMIGSPIAAIIPAGQQGEEEVILANIRRGERPGHFETTRRRKDGRIIEVALTISPILDRRGTVIGASKIARDLRDQKTLAGEILHRSRNTLSIVQAIAGQTFRTCPAAEKNAFFERLDALAREHRSLTESNWTSVDAADTLRRSLGPFLGSAKHRVALSGPPVMLSSRMGLFFAMIVHELATNSVKHGSLSTRRGRVALSWKEVARFLEIDWQESGGSPVSAPSRKGFGSRLMERIIEAEGGASELNFEKAGFHCKLRLPTGIGNGNGVATT